MSRPDINGPHCEMVNEPPSSGPSADGQDSPGSRSLDPLPLALHDDLGPVLEEVESKESRQLESGPVVTRQPLQSEDQEDLKPDALDVTSVACGMHESQMLINEQCSNGWPNKEYGPSQENQDHNKGERPPKRSKSPSTHHGVRTPSSKHINQQQRSGEAVSRRKGSTKDTAANSQVPIEAADGCCLTFLLGCLFCQCPDPLLGLCYAPHNDCFCFDSCCCCFQDFLTETNFSCCCSNCLSCHSCIECLDFLEFCFEISSLCHYK